MILWSRDGWGKVRKDKELPSMVANLKIPDCIIAMWWIILNFIIRAELTVKASGFRDRGASQMELSISKCHHFNFFMCGNSTMKLMSHPGAP